MTRALNLLVLLSANWWAGDPPPLEAPVSKVKVTVVAIHATDKNADVDAKLACIAREMKDKDKDRKLTGFKMGTTTSKSVTIGGKEAFPLGEEQECVVHATRCAEHPERVCLKVKSPKCGCITYSAACGKYFPFLTGFDMKNGDRLIIAVMVEDVCNPKDKKK